MDLLVILLVLLLAGGVHSAIHGVVKPLADRAYPAEASPPSPPPAPAAIAATRRRRVWLVLAIWILIGSLMQLFPR
ncbi:MAG: hypothetical protein J0I72_03330 [Stenotrophomonas sp.]|nr:hypothetical protein [Xanthomonadales bacterium]MBN8768367.1 hypothetical protein [Stenotrophomonas sp.]